MSTARPHPRTGLLSGAALLLVLLGVLAMHGVGGHAVGHGPVTPAHPHESVAAQVSQVSGHGVLGPASRDSLRGAMDPAWWTALCLAVLAGLVLVVAGRRTGAPLRVSAVRQAARPQVPGRRDRDPPSLVVLSVRRC